MKTETIFKLAIVAILGAFILTAHRVAAAPPPGGGGGEPLADAAVVVDVIAEGGDATARSSSYSSGSESYSEGSVSGSMSESYSEGSNSESISGSFSDQGQVQYAGSDVSVGGNSNNTSLRFNYEEAARTAAALTTSICQDGTSLQGVKFGLSKVNQSVFCMYTVTAQMSFMVSASMVCEDGPGYRECAGRKADLFRQGMILLKRATDIADEKRHNGLLKKLARKIW